MPTNRTRFVLLFCVAALSWLAHQASSRADDAPSAAQPDAKKYTLQYKFKPGEVIRTQVLHRVSLDTTIAGSTQTAETTSGSVKVWKITDVDPSGKITLEHSSKASTCGKESAGAKKSSTTASRARRRRRDMKRSPNRSACRSRK